MTFSELIMFAVKLLAGTGVFLVGVHLLTVNIEQLATGKIKDLFSKTADKRLVNVGVGVASTALIQSSGVTTVLIVGFVNVGIMNLYQATAMIMGANIGTTITAQIASLSAFPITTYIQLLVFVGIMMSMVCKKDGNKKAGMITAGLGLIFIGLSLMSDSMKTNKEMIQSVFETVTNPFLLFLIGIFLTALVQSSSAITSVIIAMSVAGLTIGTGGNEVLFIILGTNIGSCVTALMSSASAGANAKRASLIHFMFNTFGSVIFFVILICVPQFMEITFEKWFSSPATQIAMFHTFFNVVCTVVFLPFCNVFVKISEVLIKEKKTVSVTNLDERMLTSPSIAITQIEKEMLFLSDTAMDAFRTAYQSFDKADASFIESAQKQIAAAGEIYSRVISYLVQLSAQSNLADEQRIADLHNNLGDIMRIAEIADNFTKYTKKTVEHKLEFSDSVKAELREMVGSIERLYKLTAELISDKNSNLLVDIDFEENKIDNYRKRLINDHIRRLNEGKCKPESSGVFINLVSNIERLGDHLTYIAYTVK